ncbi:MAG: M20/M25/M40 family metallo-hydrolase [Gammaproteobacteria bacterium]|nr:M20/M25/M40 family metallo-hydrolase [Gammaproteobacteria bacterium]
MYRRIIFSLLLSFCLQALADERKSFSKIDDFLEENLEEELSALIKIPTFRSLDSAVLQRQKNEISVRKNLAISRDYLKLRVKLFNQKQKHLKLRFFEWPAVGGALVKGQHRWVYGVRLGSGAKKISLITHIDTVSPGADAAWKPFTPRFEQRQFMGREQAFFVGRGAIDNKGPAVVALNVLKAIANEYDNSQALDPFTLELLFDTAEETDMAMPFYLKDPAVHVPDYGVVFDAMWCIRAEKGIERPRFFIKTKDASHKGLWLASIDSSSGPVNQIPDMAVAVIHGVQSEKLAQLAEGIQQEYQDFVFDDPEYARAELKVSSPDKHSLVLTTFVSGAQHGAAPVSNRKNGANPLVSLVNFSASLVEQGVLEKSRAATLAHFYAWAWGTQVLGEKHPELLQRDDSVFQGDNGSTYALTQFKTSNDEVSFNLDIRYAAGHQQIKWDGHTEGLMAGGSEFEVNFKKLLANFESLNPSVKLKYVTKNLYAPDIRNPKNSNFIRLNRAFKMVKGRDCPMRAIGGGTDAKGHPELIAAGALFEANMGHPINFHGISEAAPWQDLKDSGRILYQLIKNDIEGI